MENTIKTRISAQQINFELINTTIENAKAFVINHEYQFKDTTGVAEINDSSFRAAINNLSKKKRKKLASSITSVTNNPTLRKVNLFFHFLMKDVMKSESRVRVTKSAKHLIIEEKRKVYREALAKVRAAYDDYKEEKGDFFTSRLTKGLEVA